MTEPGVNPVCHDNFWITEVQALNEGSIQGQNDPALVFPEHPFTTGYNITLGGNQRALQSNESVQIPVGPQIRTFVEYLPVLNEIPVFSIGVTYLSAVAGGARIRNDATNPPNVSTVNFFNELSVTGSGAEQVSVFDNAYLPPGGPEGNFIAKSGQLEGGVYGNFLLKNGRWIATPTLFHTGGFAGITMEIVPKSPPEATSAGASGRYTKAYKVVEVAGRQIASGWIPADIDADNAVGPSDMERIVAAFESNEYSANWDPFADLDKDGEVGPSDFELIVSKFGYDITFEMAIPSPPDPKNTFPYYNFDNF